ncbi:putative mRNA 3-end processing factor [Pedobacter sp. UYEF25]
MILDNFITINSIGLYCPYGDFYLDPQQAVATAVISHAHGDHAVRGNEQVYCTAATAAFMKHRYRKAAGVAFSIKNYHQEFMIGEVHIILYPAGHMLGSAQVLMIYKGLRYLYSGDYKLEEDFTCEPLEFVEADVFITESTFADPSTKHPAAAEEVKKLNETNFNIMLGAYSLGKGQRMVQLLNAHCEGKMIMLHHNIAPIAKIYEDFGIHLGSYKLYDRKTMKQEKENQVYIVPPIVFNNYFRATNVVRAFASGWKNLQERNGISLFISDHADWQAILETIKRVNPKQVWTLHGDGRQLKQHFDGALEVRILNQ